MRQITMKYFVTWIVYTHADIAWQSSSSLLCWHPAVFLGLPATLNNYETGSNGSCIAHAHEATRVPTHARDTSRTYMNTPHISSTGSVSYFTMLI